MRLAHDLITEAEGGADLSRDVPQRCRVSHVAFYTISILELQSSHVDWYCRLFVWSLLLLRRSGCW
jgi:hypothetical protein